MPQSAGDQTSHGYGHNRKSSSRPRVHLKLRHKISLTVSLGTFLLSSACVILVLYYWNDAQNLHEREQDILNQMCIDCGLLSEEYATVGEDALPFRLRRRESGGTVKCCPQDRGQLASMIGLILRKSPQDKESYPTMDASNFSLSRVSAHKRLVTSSVFDTSKHDSPYFPGNGAYPLHFDVKTQDVLREHERNVRVTESNIEVMVPGPYFVYSSVNFMPDSARPCSAYKFQTWGQKVVRTSVQDQQSSGVLLTSEYTCCDACKRVAETAYAGGVFILKANDKLHVEVTGQGLVSFKEDSSYFGLTMLGMGEII